jgi:hypothetical protein
MKKNVYNLISKVQGGYPIYKNCFAIIRPEATVNMITNPQMFRAGAIDPVGGKVSPAGYAAVGGGGGENIEISDERQRRGPYSCKVDADIGVTGGISTGGISLTVDETYTFSFDLWGYKDAEYRVTISNAAFAVVTQISMRGSEFWTRHSITYTAKATEDHYIRVLRVTGIASIDALPFYVDGFQLENKSYPTTYCDGTLLGFDKIGMSNDLVYGWTGEAHMSTSFRTKETRSGGREIFLSDNSIGFKVTGINGLGYPPVENSVIPVQAGGAFYQGTNYDESRTFAFSGVFEAGAGFPDLHTRRANFLSLIRFDKTFNSQQCKMIYYPVDECGAQKSESSEIICAYSSGMGMNINNYFQEEVIIVFDDYSPGVEEISDNAKELLFVDDITTGYCVKFENSGFDDLNTGADNAVYVIKRNPVNGLYYFGGTFHNIGGGAALHIASYNPVTDTFAALGAGVDDYVNDLDFDASGNVYPVGAFLNAGGAAASYIAKWDINMLAWSPLGAGPSGIGLSVAVAKLTTQTIVWVGLVVNTGGANYNLVDVTDDGGVTWASEVTGASVFGAFHHTRVILRPGVYPPDIFMVSNFPDAGLANTYSRVRIRSSAYALIGEFTSTGDVDGVTAMEIDDVGSLFVAGTIERETTGPTLCNAIMQYTGSTWLPLGDGLSEAGTLAVNDLHYDNGKLWAVGMFDSSGIIDFLEPVAYWTGSTWVPGVSSINLPGIPEIYTITVNDGNIYLGYSTTGAAYIAYTNTVTSGTVSPSYPKILVKGPISLYTLFKNDRGINFSPMDLYSDETATINLDPEDFYLNSNVSGNIQHFIVDGSETERVYMENGDNYLTLYASDYIQVIGDLDNFFSDYEGMLIDGLNSNNGKLYVEVTVAAGLTVFAEFFLNAARTQKTAEFNAAVAAPGVAVVNDLIDGGVWSLTVDNTSLAGTYLFEVNWGLVRVLWNDKFSGIDEVSL